MDSLKTLRKLAQEYYALAMSPVNTERMALHRAVNDLKMERPIVLLDEIPWHEINFDNSLTLQCTEPILRGVEDFLRKKMFQWKYFPGDMILPPFISVGKRIKSTDIGITVQEEILDTASNGGYIVSHKYIDQLATEEDLEKIKLPVITYDEKGTMEDYTKVAEAIGDIIPVKITGHGVYLSPWDDISRFRGVDNLLMDLVDRPEFTHAMVSKIFECEESRYSQMEELGLFEQNSYYVHCTAALCSDLDNAYDGGKVLRKHVWGRGMAQIFSSVGKDMHEEFDIDYMKKLLAPFGANYYGCCEPLDKKIDIVEKIPNLRKISITPWADVDVSAEIIGNRYVLSNKPNPASVGLKLNEEALREELGHTLAASKRNHCNCELVLKDISSVGKDIHNLMRWEQIAMELVKNY